MKKFKLINIAKILTIVCLVAIMLFFETKKEGFNEDEIFSYGSANYALDYVYEPYGDMNVTNKAVYGFILKDNWLANIFYYLKNPIEFNKLRTSLYDITPVWKSREKAKEYLTIEKEDVFNYFSTIYNQARDVHPPLFYILVHFVSSIYLGHFSKYIIFSINLIFFILTCIFICKIFKLYNKEKWGIVALILYGGIGAISCVMFQRMYMMLSFFIVAYVYVTIKIARQGLTKKNKTMLGIVTICGFLTQYYFCLVALSIFIILLVKLKKKWLWENIKLGILGVVLFPASIYHIFFSYRGIGRLKDNYFSRLTFFIEETFKNLSIGKVVGYVILICAIIYFIYYVIKNRKNKRIYEYLILGFPVIFYYLIIAKTAPYEEQRYILPMIPLICIASIFMIAKIVNGLEDNLKKAKIRKMSFTIIIVLVIGFQAYSISTNEPSYLYEGYSKNIELAKEYSDKQFIYVGLNTYNHIKNMPEFAIYKESLILNEEQVELLNTINIEDSFVICIKDYVEEEKVCNLIEEIGYKNKKLILDCDAIGFEANYYLIER